MQMTRISTKRERWRLDYGLSKFCVPKQQESSCRGDPRWNCPNVQRDFLNAHVRIIADSFRSNRGLECSAFQEYVSQSYPHSLGIPMNSFNDASECQGTFYLNLYKAL
jgi:hypothetical protein